MPQHNEQNRGARSRKRRVDAGLPPADAFKNSKTRLAKFITRQFYNSHIVLVQDPERSKKLGDAKREKPKSSCLILNNADVARLIAVVKARRSSGNISRAVTYDSRQQFEIMCWEESGKGERVNATFKYNMLETKGSWYIHHLEGISNSKSDKDETTSIYQSELDVPDFVEEEYSFDYEKESDFEDLRNLFQDDD